MTDASLSDPFRLRSTPASSAAGAPADPAEALTAARCSVPELLARALRRKPAKSESTVHVETWLLALVVAGLAVLNLTFAVAVRRGLGRSRQRTAWREVPVIGKVAAAVAAAIGVAFAVLLASIAERGP